MAALGSLVVKLGLEYAQFTGGLDKSEQAALAASKKIQDTFDGMKRGIASTAGAVAGGLAAAFTVNAFTNLIQGTMQANAALDDLSMQTGASAAALKELVEVGRFNNMGPEQIGAAMNKLSANLAGATEESKGAGKALEALGIDFKTFKAMSPDVQMQTVANAMAQFEDGTGKSAVAMALFGKQGAQMIPMLTDLAEVEDLRTKLTEEQVEAQKKLSAQSANLDDNILRITRSSEKWKKELADGMIPALDLGAQAVLDLMNGSGGLREEVRKLAADGSIKEWTMNAIKGLSYVADAGQIAWRVLQSIGKGVGGLAAALVQALNGDFRAAWSTLQASGQDMIETFDGPTIGERFRVSLDKMAESAKGAGQAVKETKPDLNDFTNNTDKAAKSASEAKDPFDALRDSIIKTTAAYQAEESAGGKLTEGQKKAIEALDQLRTGKVKVTEAQAIQIGQDIEAMLIAEQANAAREQFIKTADAERAARMKIVTAMEQSAASAADQNQSLRDEIELIGLTEVEQVRILQLRNEALILTKEATLAELERGNAISGTMTREQIALASEIEQLRERNALIGAKSERSEAAKSAKESADAWKKASEDINNTLTDALMRGFESGKGFAQTLRDTVVNMFKTMVLRPIVSAVLAPISGGINSAMGGFTGGGGSSALGTASNAFSLYNAGSQAYTLGSQYLSGTMSGSNVLGTAWANGTGGGLDALLATNGAYGTAPAGASPWAAAAAPAAAAAAIAALVMNAFGAFRSERKVGSGLAGTLGQGNLSSWEEWRKGGTLFSGPDYNTINPVEELASTRAKLDALRSAGLADSMQGALLQGQLNSLEEMYGDLAASTLQQSNAIQSAYDALRTNVGNMADVLGLGSDAVRKFTTQLGGSDKGLNFEGLSGEQQQAKIAEALATANNELAQQVIGQWVAFTDTVTRVVGSNQGGEGENQNIVYESFTSTTSGSRYIASEFARDGEKAIDTLTRLATSLTSVTAIFDTMGLSVYEASIKGAAGASKFVDAFGGLEQMNAAFGAYYDLYYSEQERIAATTKTLTAELAKLGFEMPVTRDEFRDLVTVQLAMGEAGANTAAGLLGLSGAFASIVPAADAVTESVKAMTTSLDDYISKTARSSTEADRIRGLAAVGNTSALKRLGIPGYASGGYHSGGLRLVGENGPELEVTGPANIISNPVTDALLNRSSGGNARLESLVERLVEQNNLLRAEVRAVVTHTGTSARILKRVTPDGDALQTREVVPA